MPQRRRAQPSRIRIPTYLERIWFEPSRPTDAPAEYELPEQEKLQRAHDDLMGQYVAALTECHERRGRRFVASHIKNRLDDIAATYKQLGLVLSLGDDRDGYGDWLDRSAKRCLDVGESLNSLRIPSLISALGLVGGFIAARGKDVAEPLERLDSLTALRVGIWALTAASYLYIFGVRPAFVRKRRTFLGKVKPSAIRNIYETEDRLYERLKRHKRAEFPLDSLIEACAISAICFALVVLLSGQPLTVVLVGPLQLPVALIGFGYIAFQNRRRRTQGV